jgi:hypothetical protein
MNLVSSDPELLRDEPGCEFWLNWRGGQAQAKIKRIGIDYIQQQAKTILSINLRAVRFSRRDPSWD